ncbi:MFS transporter [Halobaculum sp. MBLA0143]|uniref:MFS transporter n=1 Tax=Halobaculum sp. MBLA0143 TaxID=3079933 RepID=UPI0035252C31
MSRDRFVVAVAAASRFAAGILMGTGLAFYVGEAGGSASLVGAVTTAYFLGMMLLSPFWGAVADVTGRRRAVLVVTGLAATLAVLPLLIVPGVETTVSVGPVTIPGVYLPIGVRGVYALFAVGFSPVMLTVASARGGDEGRGRALGFFNSARAAGFTGGQLAVGFLLGVLAPDGLYVVIAAASLLSTVAVVFVTDPTPTPETAPTAGEVAAEVRRRLLPAAADRRHFSRNGLGWLYVALALRNTTVIGVMGLMPVYLPGRLGLTEFQMGALLALNPAGQAAFMLLFGRLSDRVGRKPLVVGGMAGSGLFALLAAAAALVPGTTARLLVAGLAFVVIAAAFSAMTTGALAFIGDVAPDDRESELMGLRSTAKGVGGVVGPLLLGGLATLASYEAAFALGSGLALVAAGLAYVALTESRPAGARSPTVVVDD